MGIEKRRERQRGRREWEERVEERGEGWEPLPG